MAETLRERVERKIKAKADDRGAWIPVHAAVEIALEYAEREAELWNSKFLTLDKMRERAEAAERKWNEHYADCHMNSMRKERDAAREALVEYREKWHHVRACGCWNPVAGTYRDPRCSPEAK